MTQESLNAKKASYGYWASLPIVISILLKREKAKR